MIPENIEYVKIFFFDYNDKNNSIVNNLPSHIKQITINIPSKVYYLKNIPFGCKVVNEKGIEIVL